MDQNSRENKPETQKKQNQAKFLLVEAATEFAFLIAVPLIFLIFAGKWLDAKYHHKFFVIIGILLALSISTVSIGKKINDIRNKLK